MPSTINTKKFISYIVIPFLLIMFLTRTALYSYSIALGQIDYHSLDLLKIFSVGLFSDLATSLYVVTPIVLIKTILPRNLIPEKMSFLNVILFIYIYILSFVSLSELLFWEEFGARFNFIAVDYLIYRREVIGNINESYPVFSLLSVLVLFNSIVYILTKRIIQKIYFYKVRNFYVIAILIILSLLNYIFYSNDKFKFIDNQFNTEISQNGIYNLFSAFFNNSLDYEQFYLTKDNQEILANLRSVLSSDNESYASNDLNDISRNILSQNKKHKYNVVLISVESLSAEYLKFFGNTENLTTYVDSLIPQSLVFTKYYATGTRTVRGLEAMTLSIPPTPGNSILRRKNNENLFSIGSVLSDEKYDNKFIYGGFGYFDNMNYFYQNNNFETVDRADFSKEEISFSNVWGVADEDLFAKTLKEADISYAKGQPFFSFVMTTSNHRPFTYPDNKIDIPSGTGRFGGVKYTDYAVKEFIENAKTKEWFDNTIFIITADHCAGSAGKSQIPLNKYHIPLIIYSPKIIKPGVNDKLSSQIDLAPTILELLGVSYKSKFFGANILSNNFKERTFVSTYQNLGYVEEDYMIVLSPKRDIKGYRILINGEQTLAEINDEKLNSAITYYQGSYNLFKNEKLKNN